MKKFINAIYHTWKAIFDGRKVTQDYSKIQQGGNPLFVIEKAPYHPDEDLDITLRLKILPADEPLGKDKTRLALTFEEWWSQLTLTKEEENLKKEFLQQLDEKARQTTKEDSLRDIVQSLIATFQDPARKP